jgi:hypothetical protein
MDSETLLGNMSLPREHKKAQLPWYDLAIFALVVAFLGYSARALLNGRETPHSTVARLEPAQPLPLPERTPASQAAPGSTEVLRAPCLFAQTPPESFSSTARLLQLASPLCGDEAKGAAVWHGSNETTGEEIIVFVNSKQKTFATSYFSLRTGRNDLVFTQELAHGRKRVAKVQVTGISPNP